MVFAEQISVSKFSGIDNNQNAAIIDDDQAQDLLNVDITPNGKSVKKRSGYGLYKALATGQAIRGGHHFFNSNGSDVQIWGSSTSLYGIVSDATPTQIVSSATLNSTWDCTDTQGSAYCVNSSRDALIKTDGATLQTWSSAVLGTMVEVTPDRLVVAGVSASPNTLFFSQSNSFLNFTTGLSSTDPFTEVIAAPGARLTHIRWACGKLLWWKNSSFGYTIFTDQYDLENITVSDTIGTSDNSSSIDPGGTIWFRSSEGPIYSYDCSSLKKESIAITPLTQSASTRVSNEWTQTTQSDFQAGASSPTNNLSFTIMPDAVIVSSFSHVDTSTTDWNTGTLNSLVASTGSLYIAYTSTHTTNYSFESALGAEWINSGFNRTTSVGTDNCTATADDGVQFIYANSGGFGSVPTKAELFDVNNTLLETYSIAYTFSGCNWQPATISSSGHLRKRVYIKFTEGSNSIRSETFVMGGDISFKYRTDSTGLGVTQWMAIDTVTNGKSSISSGTFTSSSYDTGLQYSYVMPTVSWTANTFIPAFVLQKSSNGSTGWTDVTTSTGVSVAVNQRYVRYISTFTVGSNDDALTTLDDVTLLARSTGTYLSAVKNAPNLSAWDTFTANKQDNGGTLSFYIRSSTNSFTVNSSTPAWVAQTVGALVAASTGTYFQVASTFTITSATQTPTLNDFTVSWFDGSASDKAYAIYFDNAIWWSLAYGTGQSINNYIFRYDLINQSWLLYNIGTGGMLQQNNSLYFGSSSTGNIYKYGSGTSDAGSTINAYWKSKDFTGQDPFLENQYLNVDSFLKRDPNQTLTVSYALNSSTSTTSYSINLSSSTQSVIRNKKLLPNGKIGGTFNIQFGDTSDSSSWELFGFRVQYNTLPYRPTQ